MGKRGMLRRADELRDLHVAERAGDLARRTGDQALERVGGWLATAPVADRLGIEPKRRPGPGWPGVFAAFALGVATAMFLRRRAGQLMDEAWETADEMAPPLGEGQIDLTGDLERQGLTRTETSTHA